MDYTFRREPVWFLRHARDGMNAEGLTEDDILEAMRHGSTKARRSGRREVEHRKGSRAILVRYDPDPNGGWRVVSVSRRAL